MEGGESGKVYGIILASAWMMNYLKLSLSGYPVSGARCESRNLGLQAGMLPTNQQRTLLLLLLLLLLYYLYLLYIEYSLVCPRDKPCP